jgi:rubrerythrin
LGSPESIGNLFFCCSVLERKTSEMYHELSRKFDQSTIKAKLLTMAQDSLKHCNLFEELSEDLIKKLQLKNSVNAVWVKHGNTLMKSPSS